MPVSIEFQGNCQTTAMGIMPHKDVDRALALALGFNIPFWPQLPGVSYFEDMYAQASEYFPGVTVDAENKRIYFDSAQFEEQLIAYSEKMAEPGAFSLSESYSVVYHRFLANDLNHYTSIRGQFIGPVSFGFKVTDENNKPIIYNDQVRTLLFDFIQRKINAQYHELKKKNENAFVWLDEPGLGWVFSGLSGYNDVLAKQEYHEFMSGIDGPRALHLCANVNLPYLLGLGIDILSFDAYQIEFMPKGYAEAIAEFLRSGRIISWGLVPTNSSALEVETPEKLAGLLCSYWEVVAENSDVSTKRIAEQALVAPARCCLKNIGQVGASHETTAAEDSGTCDLSLEERIVEKAFDYLKTVSMILRGRFDL